MITTTHGRYRKPRNRKPLALVAAAFVIGVLVLIGACSTDDRTPGQRMDDELAAAEEAAYEEMTTLEQVADDCNIRGRNEIQTADAGSTLLIDHQGEDETTGASIDAVACALMRLDMPTSLTSRIDSTRALDGMQSGEWDGYTASWTYHPDDGLNIIIEAAS